LRMGLPSRSIAADAYAYQDAGARPISSTTSRISSPPGIEAFRGEVYQLLARGDLDLDLGIGLVERGDHRLEDQRDDRSGNSEAQEPRGTLPQVTRDFAGGENRSPASVRPTLRVVRVAPMAITGQNAPAKIAVNPTIEKAADTVASANAVVRVANVTTR
jgi:hypothetical protein